MRARIAAAFLSMMANQVHADDANLSPHEAEVQNALPDIGGQAEPYASLSVTPGVTASGEDAAASTLPQKRIDQKSVVPSTSEQKPAVSASLGRESTIDLGSSSTNFRFQDSDSKLDILLGLGYSKQEAGNGSHSPFAGSVSGSTLLTPNLAVGTDLAYSHQWREVVLNAAYRQKDSPFLFSGSVGYARGSQDFDFGSGEIIGAKLGQYSYLGGLTYVPKSQSQENYLGLQSAGIRVWGANATQKDDSMHAPSISFSETDSAYNYYVNNYKLSTGRLFGANVNGQYAFSENIVAKVGLGYETVTYPFQDGSVERSPKIYRSIEAYFQPDWLRGIIVGGKYKNGAAEQLKGISLTADRWSLTAEKIAGINGVQGSTRVMLNHRFSLDKDVTRSIYSPLAQKMQPNVADGSRALLDVAATRPTELPRVFLAKVDATANKNIAILKNCLSSSVAVTPQQTAIVPIGTSPVISAAQKNNVAISANPVFTVNGDSLVVQIQALAVPKSVDNYVVDLVDSAGAQYQVFLTAENSSTSVCKQ